MLAEAAEHRVIGSSILSGSHYLAGIFLCGHMLTAAIERSDTGYSLRALVEAARACATTTKVWRSCCR